MITFENFDGISDSPRNFARTEAPTAPLAVISKPFRADRARHEMLRAWTDDQLNVTATQCDIFRTPELHEHLRNPAVAHFSAELADRSFFAISLRLALAQKGLSRFAFFSLKIHFPSKSYAARRRQNIAGERLARAAPRSGRDLVRHINGLALRFSNPLPST
jgi:hypothetical protein